MLVQLAGFVALVMFFIALAFTSFWTAAIVGIGAFVAVCILVVVALVFYFDR